VGRQVVGANRAGDREGGDRTKEPRQRAGHGVSPRGKGYPMKITRYFTKEGQSPYHGLEFEKRSSEIRNPDGSVVFRAGEVWVPAHWSQVATDILAQKYFRKAGVPAMTRRVAEKGVPEWLSRSVADDDALSKMPSEERFAGESDAREVFNRL